MEPGTWLHWGRVPPPSHSCLQAPFRMSLPKITPGTPPSCLGELSSRAHGWPHRPALYSPGRRHRGRSGRQLEDTGSLGAQRTPPTPCLPACDSGLWRSARASTPGTGCASLLATPQPPQATPPSRSLPAQPIHPLSLPVSVSLLFFSAVPPSRPPSLAHSSSFLAGRGRGWRGGSTLRPPWGLIRRGARRERAGRRRREGEKGRKGRQPAGAASVSECVSECECRLLPLSVPPAEGPGSLGRAGGLLGGRGSERRRRGEPRRRRRREERAEQPLLRETLQTKAAPDSPRPPAPQAGPLAPGPQPSGHCNFPPGLWPPRGGPRPLCASLCAAGRVELPAGPACPIRDMSG